LRLDCWGDRAIRRRTPRTPSRRRTAGRSPGPCAPRHRWPLRVRAPTWGGRCRPALIS